MTWTITHIASQDPGKTTSRIADERDQPVAYVLQEDKAALLAAAPELLTWLRWALVMLARERPSAAESWQFSMAQDAINKATQ